MDPALIEEAARAVENAHGPERWIFAAGLGALAVVWLLDKIGIFDRLRRSGGNSNGKLCLILERQGETNKEMLTEQRTTNELLRESRRDHERLTDQLERIEHEASQR